MCRKPCHESYSRSAVPRATPGLFPRVLLHVPSAVPDVIYTESYSRSLCRELLPVCCCSRSAVLPCICSLAVLCHATMQLSLVFPVKCAERIPVCRTEAHSLYVVPIATADPVSKTVCCVAVVRTYKRYVDALDEIQRVLNIQ